MLPMIYISQFSILPEVVYTEDRNAKDDQNRAGNAIEGLWLRLIGKKCGELRKQQSAQYAHDEHYHVRCAADGEVADSAGQGSRAHNKHTGADRRFQLVTQHGGQNEQHHHAAACPDEAADKADHCTA